MGMKDLDQKVSLHSGFVWLNNVSCFCIQIKIEFGLLYKWLRLLLSSVDVFVRWLNQVFDIKIMLIRFDWTILRTRLGS